MFNDVPDSIVGCNTIHGFVRRLTDHAAESMATSQHEHVNGVTNSRGGEGDGLTYGPVVTGNMEIRNLVQP